jgi:hypothetical protein
VLSGSEVREVAKVGLLTAAQKTEDPWQGRAWSSGARRTTLAINAAVSSGSLYRCAISAVASFTSEGDMATYIVVLDGVTAETIFASRGLASNKTDGNVVRNN